LGFGGYGTIAGKKDENGKGSMEENHKDPRIYMAAERTFLAWIRTGIALMVFGFVIARFGIFLRTIANVNVTVRDHGSGFSLWLGLGLIGLGILVCVVSAFRHNRYVQGIDAGSFRNAFGSHFAFGVVAFLALAGAGMVLFLIIF
jgi:putative membrane protein